MKKIVTVVWLAIVFLSLAFGGPALASDTANGAKVFGANCAQCHLGGGNVIMGNKTLKKDDLEKWDMASLDTITYQVINGKNAMPSFKGRLNKKQIEDVAAYVLEQAENGWS